MESLNALADARALSKVVSDLDKHIRSGNRELALVSLGLLRSGLGNRIAQDSMMENLKMYEEAQARLNMPPKEPPAIGGFESIDISIQSHGFSTEDIRPDSRFEETIKGMVEDGLIEIVQSDVSEKPRRKRRTKAEMGN